MLSPEAQAARHEVNLFERGEGSGLIVISKQDDPQDFAKFDIVRGLELVHVTDSGLERVTYLDDDDQKYPFAGEYIDTSELISPPRGLPVHPYATAIPESRVTEGVMDRMSDQEKLLACFVLYTSSRRSSDTYPYSSAILLNSAYNDEISDQTEDLARYLRQSEREGTLTRFEDRLAEVIEDDPGVFHRLVLRQRAHELFPPQRVGRGFWKMGITRRGRMRSVHGAI